MPAAFASQIAACAGLRNRLVHEYDEIDPRLHEGLPAAARDIPEYLRHVYRRLEGGAPSAGPVPREGCPSCDAIE